MKRTERRLPLFMLTIILLHACGPSNDEENGEASDEGTQKQEQKEEEPPAKRSEKHKNEVSLDNGEKWQANPETTKGIEHMRSLVNGFSEKENSQAYKELGDTLSAEFDRILNECTMEGEAHQQLHNYLLPMKAMFKGLGSDELKTRKKNYRKLKKHLEHYSNYFE